MLEKPEHEPKYEPPPERLSIAHLLVWTGTSALLLGYQRAMNSFSNTGFAHISDTIAFLYAPLFGAGLGACLLAAWRIARGGPQFPRQPGHWLLVVSGITGLVSLSLQALLVMAMFQASIMPVMVGIRILSGVTSSICFAFAMRDVRGIWRWIMVWAFLDSLLLLLASFGLSLLASRHWNFFWLFWLETNLDRLLTGGVVIAATVDIVRREQRDYLHWVGVAVRVGYSLLIFAIPFLMGWLRPAA